MVCPFEFMKFSLAPVSIFYKVESYYVCKSKLWSVHEPHEQPSPIAQPTVCRGLISFTQTYTPVLTITEARHLKKKKIEGKRNISKFSIYLLLYHRGAAL